MNYQFRIQDFASFKDSHSFEIKQGLNVFIGINNSGKTALLWALGSLATLREGQFGWKNELNDRMERYTHKDHLAKLTVEFAPEPSTRKSVMEAILGSHVEVDVDARFSFPFVWEPAARELYLAEPLEINFAWKNQRLTKRLMSMNAQGSYHTDQIFQNGPKRAIAFKASGNTRGTSVFKFQITDPLYKVLPHQLSEVVFLSAHRNPITRQAYGAVLDLDLTASNLAQVLATAQLTHPDLPDGHERVQKLQEYLREFFPEIIRVRTETIPGQLGDRGEIQIVLDMKHATSVPLANAGSGVYQILTLLTLALLKSKPALFLIDEPHSFLHAASERTLVRVLGQLGKTMKHIFVVTTHSPLFASQVRGKLNGVILQGEHGSRVVPLLEVAQKLEYLGISRGDLFTFDAILFVEGESDVKVIEATLLKLDSKATMDRIKVTQLYGDSLLKSTRNMAQVREILASASGAPFTSPIAFLLDSNDWTEAQKTDAARTLNKPLKSWVGFLAKPELEDYLLNVQAISKVMMSEAQLRSVEVDEGSVRARVESIVQDGGIKGSAVIAACFQAFELTFQKAIHSPLIAKQIADDSPDELKPLFLEIAGVIQNLIGPEGNTGPNP